MVEHLAELFTSGAETLAMGLTFMLIFWTRAPLRVANIAPKVVGPLEQKPASSGHGRLISKRPGGGQHFALYASRTLTICGSEPVTSRFVAGVVHTQVKTR